MLKKLFFLIFNVKEYKWKKFSLSILMLIYAIGFIGVYLISILQDADEQMYQKQIKGYIAGIGIILFIAIIDYHFIAKMFVPLYIVNMALLLICRYSNSLPIYGWSHYDARRWIKIGGDPTLGEKNPGFEFQPSEITKIVMIIFIAKLFDLLHKYIKKIWVLMLTIVLMAVPTLFIFLQPDLSTTLCLLMVFAIMVFVSEVPLKYIFSIVAIVAPVIGGLLWYVQQDFQSLLRPWQQNRVLAAIHPEDYPELMYQQTNAKAAIQQGGLLGRMLTGDTGVRGTNYVPVVESDFIFSAVAEEFGFIGSILVILLYLLIILMIIRIAKRAKDYLGTMIALGIGGLIMIQVFVNIGVVTSLLPNTGIPLPFMSAGLSALLINFVLVGLILNISMQPKDEVIHENSSNEFEFLN